MPRPLLAPVGLRFLVRPAGARDDDHAEIVRRRSASYPWEARLGTMDGFVIPPENAVRS